MDQQSQDWRTSSFSFSNGACVEVAGWRKSSLSLANTNCVEAGSTPGAVCLRDTADRGGPVLSVPAAAFTAFTASLR